MRQVIGIACVLALLATIACGGPSARDSKRREQRQREAAEERARKPVPRVDASVQERLDETEASLRLSEVRLSPSPLTAAVDLTAEPLLAEEAPEDVSFEYRWFVDDQPLEDAIEATLSRENYRKKQWVFCEARAISGEEAGAWKASKFARVVNLPPEVAASPMEGFSVPGDVSYQISASDPDGDPLTYELLSPLDEGIVLDPNTGLLSWKLEVETVERLGETIEIQFAVKDDDGQKTTGSLTLRLTAQRR
jgi:hypothetical protein